MASYELLNAVAEKTGAKRMAHALGLSLSLIHQWMRARNGRSEALNPLDRVASLIELSGDHRLAQWVCERAGGFFVPNPPTTVPTGGLAAAASETVLETVKCLGEIAAATKNGQVSAQEAVVIRSRWEKMKSAGESFVQGCERGAFRLGAFVGPAAWWLLTGELPESALAGA